MVAIELRYFSSLSNISVSNKQKLNIFNQSRDRLLDEYKSLQQSYKAGKPFPHLAIDELFDCDIIYCLLTEFLFGLDDAQMNWQITKNLILESLAVNRLQDFTRTFYFWLNSADFLDALTLVVGREEKSLIGDPTFYGAGLSGILPGGKLESCCNNMLHPHLPLICEFNLIICLNNNLNNKNQGKIELYSPKDEKHKISYAPLFNRTLILPITDRVKYRITTSDGSYESSKFFSIYYWSLLPE